MRLPGLAPHFRRGPNGVMLVVGVAFGAPLFLRLVVSAAQMVVYVLKGHDFSRAVKRPEMSRALEAAEKHCVLGCFERARL